MMQIPVTSPAVLGRLKHFAKPYDFVLAPIVNDGCFKLEEQIEKPILITRFQSTAGIGLAQNTSTFEQSCPHLCWIIRSKPRCVWTSGTLWETSPMLPQARSHLA